MSETTDFQEEADETYAFIGLGSLGFHLATRLVLGGFSVYVYDLSESIFPRLRSSVRAALASDAPRSPHASLSRLHWSSSASAAVARSTSLITCLPSPSASRSVLEEIIAATSASAAAPPPATSTAAASRPPTAAAPSPAAAAFSHEFLWIEMSTNDPLALRELSSFASEHEISTLAVPVTGGVHRAAAGEITLLIGGERRHWDLHRRAFSAMGGEQIYVGTIEQAAELKAITNMLAFIHLSASGEALALAQASGIELGTAFRAISHSSGNSFVFASEGQVILNGSYQIDFTMDLALKDMGFVLAHASRHKIPTALASLVAEQFAEARARYGGEAQSTMLVRLLEERLEREFRAQGFPAALPPS